MAVDMFLRLDSVQGESTHSKHTMQSIHRSFGYQRFRHR